MSKVNPRKVAMIGCGFVGSASCFALMQSGLFSEMVLIDANQAKAEGEAMDIAHGLPFARPMNIYAGTYDDIADAAIIIVSEGAAQAPGETRLDLVKKNIRIFGFIMPELKKRDIGGVLVIVANPVDVLTYAAIQMSGLPENRVFGTGTVLDSARLKTMIGDYVGVDSRNCHAYVVGEHGDSEIVAWSSAKISGLPLVDYCMLKDLRDYKEQEQLIAERVKNSAYEIIERKGATYYGIAMSVKRVCEAVIRDEKTVLPVSHLQHGEYGVKDVAMSTPALVGINGIEGEIPIDLNMDEQERLLASARTLREVLDDAMPKD
jgi:L-lactate dehydrogenase